MKKIKFFLTVSTFSLAFAAVASTKANSRVHEICYLEDPFTGTCTLNSGIDCDGDLSYCKDFEGRQLFKFNPFGPCSDSCRKN